MTTLDRYMESDPQFFLSANERDRRRAEKIDALSSRVGKVLLGKQRPSMIIGHPIERPRVIDEEQIQRLGEYLGKSKYPVLDHITSYPAPYPVNWETIQAYTMGGNARFGKEKGVRLNKPETREQWQEERNRKIRQTQHIADKVQTQFRTGLRIAQIRRKALSSVQDSVREGLSLNRSAAYYASEAIEDLGITMRYDPTKDVRNKSKRKDNPLPLPPEFSGMPMRLEHIGAYATDEDPEFLQESPNLLRLVQIEQGRRKDFWQEYYDLSINEDRDRRTTEIKWMDLEVVNLINSFQFIPQE